MNSVMQYLKTHKKTAALLGVVFLTAIYFVFFRGSSSSAQAEYTVTQATQGTLVTSVSGTGQISASNQIDLVPKSSGTYVYANQALAGKFVNAGTLIAEIDPTQAQQAVRSAQIDLQSAQLALAKLQANQQNSGTANSNTLTNAQNALNTAYQDGFNDVATDFIHLPAILNDARLALYGTALSSYGCEPDYCAYKNAAGGNNVVSSLDTQITNALSDYQTASTSYAASLNAYNNTKYTADPAVVEPLITQTLKATQDLAQAIKSENTMLATVVSAIQTQIGRTLPSGVTSYQSTLAEDLSTITGEAATLQTVADSITTNKQNVATAQQNISSSTQTNPIDVQTQQNVVAQRQAAVDQAQSNLAEYFIRAPFDGIVASVNAVKGLQSAGLGAASGSSAAAVMISSQQIVQISLNEVDAANVKAGQQATMTFDALPGLTLTGKVASVDIIGTVTQGVVSYNTKIAFDSQDSRIKPGMSASASVITAVKQNALEVPIGAVKTVSGQSYVQTVALPDSLRGQTTVAAAAVTPAQVPVTVGLTNSTMAEIISGLNLGDTVVTRTIAPTAASSGAARTGATGGNTFFGGGAAGGGVRALSR